MTSKLDAYRVFNEVAKQKSFSRAAKALYMTQPAVSQTIMNLEEELGTRLFTRTSKGVVLTNDGQLLYEYISSALNLIEMGERKISESKNLMVGEMKLGVGDTISKYYLLPYLEKFHSDFPNVKLKIINRTTLELCAMLKSGEIDIAVCNLPVKDPAIEVLKCIDIHDVFVCGEKYRYLAIKPRSIEEILQFPVIFLESKSNSRQYVEKYFLAKGIKIQPEIELGSHDLLLEFAKFNFGISCVIEEFAQEYLSNRSVYKIRLLEEIPARAIGFCFLKSVSLSAAARKFVSITLER
ncbi:HTH-type transcriptional regulator CynR [Thermoclostridium stercorarium subsp. stercorarium DSM 8532]|jgi:DNA-binding transcriptional LysR family regulator|uniref:HTH-type transcriptional regulator CynR n=3 Tax=Thermoclostridium stercorarium TaxID=1510 RepID=L7VMN2_THES1|nr:LysR family transcriptional regulator [Thermoclostridium stercorarium]AGC68007.1 HTH-type transcriptional regulator CynR [Thermoclostridium stercorarium subsp. stercorarium DSM 8532]AGI39041.1 transcriptional regulator [Thermoclostridium stercorarium subsp. stercorarium DSM 8532]ANW98406.1 LysR family transcriptional regulator [Thermoclostridium stercorarium subsp. thermolacticum DSM 2910]ANX00942.1 LysR family transcriptional regulator [Thermoclostridium stercorarium subsp. leptospartum DSM